MRHAHFILGSFSLDTPSFGAVAGDKGYYIAPTVFSNVDDSNTIAKDEIFGPVQSILKWYNLEDVLVSRTPLTHAIGFCSPLLAWLFAWIPNFVKCFTARDHDDWYFQNYCDG